MPPPDYWKTPGKPIAIGAFKLPDGMVYVGDKLSAVADISVKEPALIDPALRVDVQFPDRAGDGLSYWPSYSTITPACRAGYLEWLAGGRKDPTTNIGFVFLFLYGLERRVLQDRLWDPRVKTELPAIIAELERLLSIYTASRSFQRYASRLLEVARATHGAGIETQHVLPISAPSGELPFLLRAIVGHYAREGKPLPVDWAWAWVNCDPGTTTRTPRRRCPSEFETVFRARYAARFGEGAALKNCQTKVRVSYTAASSSFPRDMPLTSDVPDVTSLVEPRKSLLELAEECCEALEPLSRLRGKGAESADPLQLIGALPPELLASHAPPELVGLRSRLEAAVGDRDFACVSAAEMFGAWLPPAGVRPTKSSTVDLLRLADRAGFGVEPDVRFGGSTIDRDDRVVVFRASEGEPMVASPAYGAAALLARLAGIVAHGDGSLSEAEQRQITDHTMSALFLSEAEQRRLRANIAWMAASPPDTTKLKQRLEEMSTAQREAAARFVVDVALADGRVDPGEVKSLGRIFKLLGLDPTRVHEVIHAAQSGSRSEALARVPASTPAGPEYAIPTPATTGARTAPRPLDMASVESKLRESAKVAAILGEILAPEEPEPAPAVPQSPASGADRVRSLDDKHSRLLRALGERVSWAREDYEQLASDLGLLPDGALEVVNELAFETCDAALCEGDDPIEVDRSVYEELLK